MKTKETTVILRTKNNEDIITQTLKALFSQNYKDFKLLIVDSGSTDNTLKLASLYDYDLIEVKPEDYYPGIVLNNAIEQTNTNLIVFLNSDTVMLHGESLQILIDELKKEDTHAVFARQVARPEAKLWVRRDYEIAFPSFGESPQWMYFSLPLSGIKRNTWKDNKFYTKAWASEDTKMGFDLRNKNLKVKYVAKAIVMHSHNYTFKQLFNRRFVEGEADVFIFNKKFTIGNCIISYFKSALNDTIYHMKSLEFYELGVCLIGRIIYQYAYYKGHQNGEKRKIEDKEATYGNYQ